MELIRGALCWVYTWAAGKDIHYIKACVEIAGKTIGTIVAVIASHYAIEQYGEKVRIDKVNKVFEYNKEYKSKNPQQSIRDMVDELQNALYEDPIAYGNATKFVSSWKDFIAKRINENELSDKVRSIVNFFDEIDICVEGDLCDEKKVIDFFGDDVKETYNSLIPYICDIRKKRRNPHYGLNLQQLADKVKLSQKKSGTPNGEQGIGNPDADICETIKHAIENKK